jgi:eukaryotic-like serine/threonine-protein kinase
MDYGSRVAHPIVKGKRVRIMDQNRWNKINELFSASLELEREEQSRFLAEACGEDNVLKSEVQQLIDAHLEDDHFIDTPVFYDAALTMANEEDELKIEQQIGPYKILKEIGRGGMGAVYLATRADQEYKKQVAIKLIKRGMDTEQVLHRFRTERQILANFDHPNIARLLEGGSTENALPYFVMEYVEGRPIDLYCDENNLSITNRLELFRQVCAAVSYAHRNLVVHRDIKPSNILITADGLPKLLDFGIAKILQLHSGEQTTATGFMPMTPDYASPEQAVGANVTTYSDIYSLGVLLYELLTGHLPYQLKNAPAMEIARIITETKPQAPSTIVKTVVEGLTPETVSKCREGTPERLRRRLRGDLDNIVLMAMRKEPHRRYQSVEQLSEDIRRHLQGHPVIARKDTFLYRGTKFIKRNKIAVAFAVLALLSIAIAGMIRLRTNQQAASFQEFGQEVARIEAAMRYAYLLPLHNIQPDKKQVLNRLEYIKKRMHDMGGVSFGPGFYSIGRGYLSLHRYQDAYDNLILAWEKYRYQTPETANALGLSLAMLYQEKLREAEQLYNRDQLTERKLQLEKQYRGPALEYIQKGANTSEAAEYVQALLTFLGKQYPEALKKARIAEQKNSWHYESKKLQGDIYAAMGNEQSDKGNIEEASDLFEKAKFAYLEAGKKGQSDPQIHDALCSIHSTILQEIQIEQKRKSSEEAVDEGIKHCKNALRADPNDINANLIASKIYKNWAYYRSDHGNDPSIAVEKSAGFARDALKIDPESALAHLALGEVYSTRSDWELFQGRDPIPFLDLSDVSYTKASQKIPEDHQLLFLLGNNSMKRAQHYVIRGEDPRPALEKTIRLMRNATQLSRQNFKYFTMLGHAYHVRGAYEQGIGLDSRDSLNKSIQFFNQSIAINPNYHVPYIWCGNSYLGLADHHINAGENPNPSLDEALKVFGKCLAKDPENFWAYAGIGIAQSRKGLALQKEGKDPATALEVSRKAFKKVLQSEPSIVGFYSYYANAELIAARYAISRRKSPETFFKESERIVNKCFSVNPDSDECLESLVALYLLRAEYLFSKRQSAEAEILSGLKTADRAIKGRSNNALVMGYRAKLFLIRAQSSSGEARQKAAREAVASFDQAFQVKNLLRREYGKDWEEAKRLAQ